MFLGNHTVLHPGIRILITKSQVHSVHITLQVNLIRSMRQAKVLNVLYLQLVSIHLEVVHRLQDLLERERESCRGESKFGSIEG